MGMLQDNLNNKIKRILLMKIIYLTFMEKVMRLLLIPKNNQGILNA